MSEEEIKNKIQTLQFSEIVQKGYKIMSNVEFDSIVNGVLQLQQENSQLKEDIKGFEQERQTLYNTIHDIQKANKQLNRKIEKAIKYIQDNKLNTNKISEMLCGSEVMTLLEILEGDE